MTVLWIAGLAIAGTATWYGMPYYLTPVDERPFSALHDLYAPTGLVGHGFGIVGTLMVIAGVTLYTARKRLPFLSRVGKLRDWLHFHIFLCLVGPFLVLLHTTFRFGGLVAISFWSMAAVVSSGVFGRYVYSWIPKTINGGFVGAQEIRDRMHDLLLQVERSTSLTSSQLLGIVWPDGPPDTDRRAPSPEPGPQHATAVSAAWTTAQPRLGGIAKSVNELFASRETNARAAAAHSVPPSRTGGESGSPPGSSTKKERRRRSREPGIVAAALEAVAFRLTRRRRLGRFQRQLRAAGVTEPTRSNIVRHLDEEARIEQQLRILRPFQRAFRYWHAFHLPLAAVMFLILGVHVAVAVAFGYTWIF